MSEMDALELLKRRRSVRKYCDRAVPRHTLESLIELACMAPSAGNRQDWFFTVVVSNQLKHAMAEAVRRRWQDIIEANRQMAMIDEIEEYAAGFADFECAPAVVAISASEVNTANNHLLGGDALMTVGSMASAAMAAQNLMLAARGFGLATCCMTGAMAARRELASLLGLERKQALVCLVTVGYAAESPAPPPRKPVSAVSRFVE